MGGGGVIILLGVDLGGEWDVGWLGRRRGGDKFVGVAEVMEAVCLVMAGQKGRVRVESTV